MNTGADNRAEETQAPPPAYETVYNTNGNNNSNGNATGINNGNASNGYNNGREPEEAGEIVAAEGDPENVGEYPNATPAAATAAVRHCLRGFPESGRATVPLLHASFISRRS